MRIDKRLNLIKIRISVGEKKLTKEVSLDFAFPNRKNSKTEALKAEILNLERQLVLLEQGLEDQTYEEYKEEFMDQLGNTGLTGAEGTPGPSSQSEQSKEDEIAELEAKLAALRG